jgi:hypothetical protein
VGLNSPQPARIIDFHVHATAFRVVVFLPFVHNLGSCPYGLKVALIGCASA